MNSIVLQKSHIHKGSLILVNATHALEEGDGKEPISLLPPYPQYPHILLEQRAATCLSHLIEFISGQQDIVPVSGYRSVEEQKQIYADSLQEHGRAFTQNYVALPNHSEHQTGLAIDVGLQKEELDFIRPDFPYQGICHEFRKKAPYYGFVERYQQGKEAVTGIAHEPWHFRYVGYPHAVLMIQRGLALEEYLDIVKGYLVGEKHWQMEEKGRRLEIFYVPVAALGQASVQIPKQTLYHISGDNVEGCVVTLWGA